MVLKERKRFPPAGRLRPLKTQRNLSLSLDSTKESKDKIMVATPLPTLGNYQESRSWTFIDSRAIFSNLTGRMLGGCKETLCQFPSNRHKKTGIFARQANKSNQRVMPPRGRSEHESPRVTNEERKQRRMRRILDLVQSLLISTDELDTDMQARFGLREVTILLK